jgi:hypothetical protein
MASLEEFDWQTIEILASRNLIGLVRTQERKYVRFVVCPCVALNEISPAFLHHMMTALCALLFEMATSLSGVNNEQRALWSCDKGLLSFLEMWEGDIHCSALLWRRDKLTWSCSAYFYSHSCHKVALHNVRYIEPASKYFLSSVHQTTQLIST